MNDYPKAFQDWWDSNMSHLSLELMPHVFEGWKGGIFAGFCAIFDPELRDELKDVVSKL